MPSEQAPPAKQEQEDCFECKATGSATFAAAGAYILWQRDQLTRRQRGQRPTMTVVACVFFGMSVGRWFLMDIKRLME